VVCFLKIPKKVQLGGLTYEIKEVDHNGHELIEGTTIGHIYYDKQLIVYSDQLKPEKQAQVFFHELIHAILLAMSMTDKEDVTMDEDFIDSFASYLHQAMEYVAKAQK
jgi:Zn-dependent peptidase ImmA (M78 family)